MLNPLVLAYHLIWTAYAHWLPNDPRGSGSKTVASDVLAELGELHFGRKKIQPAGPEIQAFYEKAHKLLKYSVLLFAALGTGEFGGYCHPIWTLGGWKVFLDHPAEVRRTIRYIRNNPIKQGLREQHWEFVKKYDDWPLHPGHNPNSPWARRLRGRGEND